MDNQVDGEPTAAQIEAEPMLKFFRWAHLPAHLQEYSKPFAQLALKVSTWPRNPERTVTLRKLLEGKDAGVRCNLP